MSDLDLYHPLILERNKNPRFYKKDTASIALSAYNPVCGDEYQIAIDIEKNKIERITFYGYGCAVSKAAIDLLIERILHSDINAAIEEIENYFSVIEMDDPPPAEHYPLSVFQKIKYHPARKQCATLGANSLLLFLREKQNK